MSHRDDRTLSDKPRAWVLPFGLAIAYSPSYLNHILPYRGANWTWMSGPPSVLVWNWSAVTLLLGFILVVERRRLASIRLVKPTGKDIGWAIFFWAIATITSGAMHAWLPPEPSDGMRTMLALPLHILILLVLTTSITEEILFRGYPIERLRERTGRTWLAVAVSVTLFVLPHLTFFGPQWLMYHGANLVLIYALYIWRRNLAACMLMHLLGNAMILVPALGLA